MKTIEVKLAIDVQDRGQMTAFTALLAAMSGAATAVAAFTDSVANSAIGEEKKETPAPTPKEEPEKQKRKERGSKAEAKETPTPPPAQEPEQAPEGEEQEEESDIKIEDVRALLAKKVENNRVGIKAKLTALGAPNVTALAKEKYAEFYTYLEGLK